MPQALLALAAWTLFAFAGAYHWTIVPTLVGTAVLFAIARPRLIAPGSGWLDGALIASLAAIALQLAPLPETLRHALSPAARRVHDTLGFGSAGDAPARLTLEPQATAWALAIAVMLIAVFWMARATFERHGLRDVSRGIAWIGMILSVVVFVQRFASPHHIYGFWAPIARTAKPTPFGPYVNRNDLATWLVLAIPLVLGYAVARAIPRLRGRAWTAGIERALDARSVVLAGAILLMTAALVASLSRSGLGAGIAGLIALALVGRRQAGRAGAGAVAAAGVALLVLALPFANVAALAARFGDTLPADVGGRVAIWRDSWHMASDFLTTGLGAGAFERGMLAYQRAPLALFFNHAHNEYLHLLAEGGLLIGLPVLVAVSSGLVLAVRRLRQDAGAFWFRAGALSGLIAVAVQSLWDTGLRMPANGVLFAIVAAIAVHEAPDRQGRDAGAHRRGSVIRLPDQRPAVRRRPADERDLADI